MQPWAGSRAGRRGRRGGQSCGHRCVWGAELSARRGRGGAELGAQAGVGAELGARVAMGGRAAGTGPGAHMCIPGFTWSEASWCVGHLGESHSLTFPSLGR